MRGLLIQGGCGVDHGACLAAVDQPGLQAGNHVGKRQPDHVGAKTAQLLEDEGFGDLDALLAADPERLEAIEGVGPKTARAIMDWAADIKAQMDDGEAPSEDDSEPSGEEASPADEGDFMAALSKALEEAEGGEDAEEVVAESDDAGAEGESEDATTEGPKTPAAAEAQEQARRESEAQALKDAIASRWW